MRILEQALSRLSAGGTLLLYTGASISDGIDVFFSEARALIDDDAFLSEYEELDPDVFGEELETELYNGVDRIAAVLLRVQKRGDL